MKKSLCILLTLCLLLTLASCKKDEKKPAEKETEPNIALDVDVPQQPMICVGVPTNTDVTTSDDGTEIFHYVYPSLELIFPDSAVAQKVLENHRNRLMEQLASAEEIRQMASRGYKPGQAFTPYLYSVTYNPMRADLGVLSILGNTSIYTGGAHPDHHGFGVNYDMVSGEVLTLGSILKHIDQKDTLRDLLITELDKIAEENYLFGYKNYVTNRFRKDESTDTAWFFTNTGLAFFFDPYEIAPYSQGMIVVEIPYTSLTGIIDDAYFPSERTTFHGTIQQIAFENADLTQFTQTAELLIQSGGSKTLYYPDTAVHDFKVSQINPVTGYENAVFYAPHLTPGDAVIINVPDELKTTLTITYLSSNSFKTINY